MLGRICFEGSDITSASPHRTAKQGIARTFQHNELFPQLTTIENLLVGRHAALDYGLISAGLFFSAAATGSLSSAKRSRQVSILRLRTYRKLPVGDLPTEYRRLSAWRGLRRGTALVLLDEPSAGLNRQEKEDLARYLLRMRHEFDPTIVWIEHDMQLVRDLADRSFRAALRQETGGRIAGRSAFEPSSDRSIHRQITIYAPLQVDRFGHSHAYPREAATAISRPGQPPFDQAHSLR